MSLKYEIPVETVLELEAEDLVEPLLAYLVKSEASGAKLNHYNFGLECDREYRDERARAKLLETWGIIEQDRFISRTHDDFYAVSGRGKKAALEGTTSLRQAVLLPRELLHEKLLGKVAKAFSRGDYPAAVRDAYTELEIAVREATDLPMDLTGEKLMGQAFNVEGGQLTDDDLPTAEREGMRMLFVGAMKLFRNPPSHRRVELSPQEAARMITLAAHLLAIVDSRVEDREAKVVENPPSPDS